MDLPTFELASVRLDLMENELENLLAWELSVAYLFKVVDLPEDGFPTRPIRGSRGIVAFMQR